MVSQSRIWGVREEALSGLEGQLEVVNLVLELVRWGSISPHHFPYFTSKYGHVWPRGPENPCKYEKTQCLPKMFTYRRNSRVLQEKGVGEHDGDVRCLTGSRNVAVSRMRNEKYAIWPLIVAESPEFLHPIGNRGRGTRGWRQIYDW